MDSFIVTFPLSNDELKKLIKFFEDEDGVLNTHLSSKNKIRRVDTLNRVKKVVGSYPLLQYALAREYSSLELQAKKARAKKHAHEERQKIWHMYGGKIRHYIKKHGHYGSDHLWLNMSLEKETGCSPDFLDEQESWEDVLPEVEEEPLLRSREPLCTGCMSRACRDEICSWLSRPLDVAREEEWELVRSPSLLCKLREVRSLLRLLPRPQAWSEYQASVLSACVSKWECADPQMEGKDGETLSTVTSSNVVLTEENPSVPSIASRKRFDRTWHKLCSTEAPADYSHLTNRWTFFKSAKWDNTQVAGAEFASFNVNLPCDFIDSVNKDGSMPMFVPFKIHKYFKSDIELKFHVNSNKFQLGQLQFSFQYLERYDGNPLNNMYSRSQLPHVLVNAGASNEATLTIPYKYIQPYMFTSQRKGNLLPLYLGTLRCFVVVPLAVGENGPDHCSVSMFVRFPNCEFTGMRDGSVADPQMMAAAASMVAAKAFDKFVGDVNCDNVSDNTNPQYLVPTASHSWCAGKGMQERLHSLRLDNSTVSVGRIGIDSSETSIGVPCRTFSMLKHIEWSIVDETKNNTGWLLWSTDVHPQLEKDKYYKEVVSGGLDKYALSPLCVIASLYKQWRGSLEFKFDIIASQFHTGRLLCAYIPGFYGDASRITLEQARNSAHIEFSLQDATSFTFTVPYIANQVFWPRRFTGPHKYNEVSSPSKLVLFVLNPLIPMPSIVNKVTIVPYVRAGPDFEVSVPVQPSIGLSNDCSIYLSIKEKIFPTDGSYPMYATNYKGFGDDKKYLYYEGTAAFGTACTFHAPETPVQPNQYYYGKAVSPYKCGTMVYDAGQGKQTNAYIGYIVLWYVAEKGFFGVPFPNNQDGEKRADKVALMLKKATPLDVVLAQCYDFVQDGTISSSDRNDLLFTPVIKDVTRLENADPQMEDRFDDPNNLMPTNLLPSTSSGQFNFNEDFSDLKDLIRRYQLYDEGNISFSKKFKSGSACLTFPVVPSGLNLKTSTDNIFNSCREGHIPVVCSSYIYFRGSIRYKIVLSSDNLQFAGCKLWIQHHPDSDCTQTVSQVWPNIKQEDSFKSHSYAYYLQALNVNSIVEFEVPFYQPGMYGLTRKMSTLASGSDVCQYYSLGNIVVGVNTGTIDDKSKFDLHYQVYYSVGDDFSLSTFRGFPMCVWTDEVWPTNETQDRRRRRSIVQITPSEWEVVSAEPQMEDAEPQMFSSFVNKYIRQPIVDSSSELASDIVNKTVNDMYSKLSDSVKNSVTGFDLCIDKNLLINSLINLLHVLNNPTPSTIAISFVGVLAQLLSNKLSDISKLTSYITQLIAVFKSPSDSYNSAEPQGEFGDNNELDMNKILVSICSIIFSSVVTLFGVTCCSPKTFPHLLSGINGSLMISNNIVRLLSNSMDLIKFCINYISCKLYPDKMFYIKLADNIPEVKAWFEESTYLLDVRNKERYLYDRSMLARVFDATVLGSLLITNGLDHSSPGGKVVFDIYKDLRKLQCNLFERGAHPDVRFETYPIWISGAPGIGKSFMVKKIANDLLKSVKFNQPGSLIYDIPSGAKYWSGCSNPAVLVSDDLFQVKGTKFEDEIANLFMICSSSVLNPPMAAVEDKERRLNPLLYIMLCNSHFPTLSPTCTHPEAVYRRRKFLIYVDLDDDIKDKYPEFRDASQLEPEERVNMKHLKFRYAFNVKDPSTTYSEWMSYEDIFEIIKDDFAHHYASERDNFKQRMIDMYCLDPHFDEDNMIMNLPGIEDKMSLKEQIETYKTYVASKLDEYNDPQRDPTAWDYIRKFCSKVSRLNPCGNPQSDEPGTSYSLDEVVAQIENISSKQIKTPEDITKRVFPHHEVLGAAYEKFFLNSLCNYIPNTCLRGEALNILQGSPGYYDKMHAFRLASLIYGLSDADGNWLDFRISECLSRVFPNLTDSESWIDNAIDEMLTIGQFDTVDSLKFLLSWDNGVHEVSKILFPRCYENTLPSFDDFLMAFPSFSIHKDIFQHSRSFRDGVNQHRAKKDSLRKALSDLPIFPLTQILFSRLFSLCLGGIFYYIMEDDKEAATFIQTNCVRELEELLSFSDYKTACRGIISFAYRVKAIIESTVARKKNFSLPLLSNVQNLVFRIIAYFNLCSILCLPDHDCSCARDYTTLCKDITNAKFCSYRKIITYKNVNIKPCTVTDCVYNCKLLFSLVALGSVSCKNVFCMTDRVPIEINDIKVYLKGSRDCIFDSWLKKIVDYSKHFLFHILPKTIQQIYFFISDYIFPILITIGLYLAQSYALTKTNHWAARTAICLATPNAISLAEAGGKLITHNRDFSFLPDSVKNSFRAFPESSHYYKSDHPKFPSKNQPNLPAKSFANPQIGASQRHTIAEKIENNSVLMYVSWLENDHMIVKSCRCLMIKARSMLILRHYIEEYDALVRKGFKLNVKLFYSKSKIVCNTEVPYEDIASKVDWCSSNGKILTSNFGLVTLPKYTPMFKDIVKLFAAESNIKNPPSFGDLYVVNGRSSFDIPISIVNNFRVNKTDNSSEVWCESVFKYNKQFKGMCGSVLVGPTFNEGNGGIIGIHVAGSDKSGDGYAEPIYRDLFEEYFGEHQGVVIEPALELLPVEHAKPKLDTNLMMYGCVPPTFAHSESGKSKIIPSLLHGTIYPVRTEVNPLRPGDKRLPPGSDPLRDGCNKHGSGDVKVFSSSLVKLVTEHLKDRVVQLVRPVRCKIEPLTWQQAVCGDTSIPYFESLNWKSSEGFPLSSHRPAGAHNKRWLFDLSETEKGYKLEGFHPKLAVQLDCRDELFIRNEKPPTIYIDCLKDHRLTPEKCAQPGRTRIFSIAPIQCSLDIKKHVNDFCASIKNSRIVNSIGIGINPDSLEWTALVNYLFEVGKNIVTLDYSNYGPCLMSQLVAASNEVIVNWFVENKAEPEHVKRVEWLLDNDILNPIHLCGNLVYQTLNGIASGSPLTGECNSIPNLFYIRLTYLEIMLDNMPELASMYFFDRLVRIVVYGDDLIMSVDDSIKDLFNGISIQLYLANHGIKVTPAQKSAEMVPYTSIYDATFLKRSFTEHPSRAGIWLAPIEKQSIEECINWIHVSDDARAATLESCRASLDLAFSQGPIYFKEHYLKIRNALNSIGLTIEHKPWHERDNEIFGESEETIENLTKISVDLPWYYGLSKESL